jgi:serine O-acetyltransferase
VGRRVRIDHHGGFFLGALSVGDDVVIRHTATIGLIRRGASRAPVIGSNVGIGPGACIVGDITVGDGAFIGPNTVVTQDVPAGAFALGNPGRLVDRARVIDAPPARAADAPPAKQPPAVAPETAPVVAQSKL